MKYYNNLSYSRIIITDYTQYTKNLPKIDASQIQFWSKSWNNLTPDEQLDYMKFRRIPFIRHFNEAIVRAAYLTDSHIFRLKLKA